MTDKNMLKGREEERMSIEFINTCSRNGLSEAQALFAEGNINLSFSDSGGQTALILAASHGHLEIVNWLLSIGAPLEMKDRDGRTALSRAAINGRLEVMKSLISAGADKDAVNSKQMTILLDTLNNKQPDAALLLLEAGASFLEQDSCQKTALHYAVQNKFTDIIKFLLEKGANPNIFDQYSMTPLSYAVKTNQKEIPEVQKIIAKLLLSFGADINYCDEKHAPAIYTLISYKIKQGIRWFLEHGTDPLKPDKSGRLAADVLKKCGLDEFLTLAEKAAAEYNNTVLPSANTKTPNSLFNPELWISRGITNIIEAVKNQNIEMIRYFIEQGTNVNQEIDDCSSSLLPFYTAIDSDNPEILSVFLEAGLNINQFFTKIKHNTSSFETYLHYAVEKAKTNAIYFLLSHGANPNNIPENYNSDYYLEEIISTYSFNERYDEIVPIIKEFFKYNITVDLEVLTHLQYSNLEEYSFDIFTLFINQCEDINEVNEYTGQSILHQILCSYKNFYDFSSSSYSYNPEFLPPEKNRDDILLDVLFSSKKIDVNLMDFENYSPLYYACKYTTPRIVEKLILLGADISFCDKNSSSLAHTACEANKADILEILLKHGIDPNSSNDKGKFLLHIACKNQCIETIQVLLNAGANIHNTDLDGNTPLHILCLKNQKQTIDLISFLLKSGADISALNYRMRTPFFISSIQRDNQYRNQTEPILKYLLSQGAEIDVQDIDGYTPLYYAVRRDDTENIKFLIKNGANPNKKNEKGESPYQLAKEKKNQNLIHIIEKYNK